MQNLIIFDANNLAYKFGWVHKYLSTKDGFPTGLLYGGIGQMLSVSRLFPSSPMIFVWDWHGKTWRHRLAPSVYKANRVSGGELPEEVSNIQKQIPIFCEFLSKLGFKSIKLPGFETDDVIGLIADRATELKLFDGVVIVSSDRDFFQLISDSVKVLRKADKEAKPIGVDDVFREFKVLPHQWTSLRAIAGDPSDGLANIIRGVGPKTAAKLIQKGLFPEFDFFDAHNKQQQEEFVKWREHWPAVRTNFVLSTILRKGKITFHPNLSKEEKQIALAFISRIRNKIQFFRERSEESWEWMEEFMLKYELNEHWQERRRLWELV